MFATGVFMCAGIIFRMVYAANVSGIHIATASTIFFRVGFHNLGGVQPEALAESGENDATTHQLEHLDEKRYERLHLHHYCILLSLDHQHNR